MCFANKKNDLRDDRIEDALKEHQGDDESELIILAVVSFDTIESKPIKTKLAVSIDLTSILERCRRGDKQ